MRRTQFWKLLLAGTGYMLLGSFMGTIITAAMSFIINNVIVAGIIFLSALVIFFSLIFLPAYKDGIKERKLVKNKRADIPAKNAG